MKTPLSVDLQVALSLEVSEIAVVALKDIWEDDEGTLKEGKEVGVEERVVENVGPIKDDVGAALLLLKRDSVPPLLVAETVGDTVPQTLILSTEGLWGAERVERELGLAMEGVGNPVALSVPPLPPGRETDCGSETEGEAVLENVPRNTVRDTVALEEREEIAIPDLEFEGLTESVPPM